MSLIQRFTKNPAGGRDLLVGDAHGCFTKLRRKLDAIGFDESVDRLFSVGDLVDRGPESAEVLHWLDEPWFHAIRGNHEEMLLEYHAGSGCPLTYAQNGGAWAIGMIPSERLPYVDALGSLPLAIELETDAGLVVLVHANVVNERWAPVAEKLRDESLPARDMSCLQTALQWDRSRVDWRDVTRVDDVIAVVVGHTPLEEPAWLGNVLHIDCGAWLKGGGVAADFIIIDAATLKPVS